MKVNFFNGSGGSGVSVPNPKVYQSIITQSGTNAPTEVVFRNDFGSAMSFTWTYVSVGKYRAVGIYNFFSPDVISEIVTFTSNQGYLLTSGSSHFLTQYLVFQSLNPPIIKDIEVIQEVAGGGRINTLVNTRFEIRIYN